MAKIRENIFSTNTTLNQVSNRQRKANRKKAGSKLDENYQSQFKQDLMAFDITQIPTYIHTDPGNYTIKMNLVNQVLRSKTHQITQSFVQECELMSKIIRDKEQAFLKQSQCKDRTEFEHVFYSVNINSIQVLTQFNILSSDILKISRGKKTLAQLKQFVEFMSKLNSYSNVLTSNVIDQSFLKRFNTTVNNWNKQLPQLADIVNQYGELTTITDEKIITQIQELTKGMSISKYILDIAPKFLEQIYLQMAEDYAQYIGIHLTQSNAIRSTAKATMRGSSADMEMFGGSFSIKMNANIIKQAKTRVMDSFMTWNKNLQDANSPLSDIITSYSEVTNLIQYVLLNYASFKTQLDTTRHGINKSDKQAHRSNRNFVPNKTILTDAMRLLIIMNLNQKLFGYNKAGQTDMTLTQIIQQLPIAVLNGGVLDTEEQVHNQIIWLADVVDYIKTQIQQSVSNADSLATWSISTAGFDRTSLYNIKCDAIDKLLDVQNEEDIPHYANVTYDKIYNLINTYLTLAGEQLRRSIQLSIQYKIALHNIDILSNKE